MSSNKKKKLIFELLTAFNIIHFIYKIVHNIYLTSTALKTTLCTVKQPTISYEKRVAKTACSLFFAFLPWLGLQIFFHPCIIWSHIKIVHPQPKWAATWPHFKKGKVHLSVGLLEATRFTAYQLFKRALSQVKCSLTCQTG